MLGKPERGAQYRHSKKKEKRSEETGTRLEVTGSQPPLLTFDQPPPLLLRMVVQKKEGPRGNSMCARGDLN